VVSIVIFGFGVDVTCPSIPYWRGWRTDNCDRSVGESMIVKGGLMSMDVTGCSSMSGMIADGEEEEAMRFVASRGGTALPQAWKICPEINKQ